MSTRGSSGLGAPTVPPVGSKGANNAIATKLGAVLSTSYSDSEFRDVLSLVDERDTRNDARTRRHIRSDLQKEVMDCNGQIINDFGRVAEQLHRIRVTLEKLNTGHGRMKEQVLAAHSSTLPALSDVTSMTRQRRQIEAKQAMLGRFKDRFMMSEDEVAALTLTAEPVDDRFFDALACARRISSDCEVLLGFENQTLGSELMEQTSKHINLGFQKLYKWVQREFKTLNLENPQMNPSIRRALRALAERPSLFQSCLDFFSDARERILSDSFYVALTGATSSGREDTSVKPIDLTAHDPLRYVGDMLAWIHSATVSEREALEVLFIAEGEELAQGLKSGRDAEVWRLIADEGDDQMTDFNALKALGDLVDRDMSGAARILRQRVEQVIQSNEETIPAYKLANLVNFYRITFEKLLGSHSNLQDCAATMEAEAMRQFRSLVRDHIATLQLEFQQTPSDFGIPSFLQESLNQLEAIAKTFDASLSASTDREAEFDGIVSEVFVPFMAGCDNMARSMDYMGSAVFIANCRLAASARFAKFDFLARAAQRAKEELAEQTRKLVRCQYDFLLDESGLRPVLEQFDADGEKKGGAISRELLRQASQDLDDFLPSALMDALERLRHLQDSALARTITEDAAGQFCSDFERLERAIVEADEDSGVDVEDGDGLRAVFPRTATEIRVLLS